MPQTTHSSAERPPAPKLLLIEEYDALALAIGSALKKFAPDYERHVVASIGEAERILDALAPALIVIDLDPPQAGVVALVERMRVAHSGSRLLAIGCGTSPEWENARGGQSGIHFVEKPFELAELGEAVSYLTSSESGKQPARGTIGDIDALDFAALECVTGGSVVLRVEAAGGRMGEIHIHEGQICHAFAPGVTDKQALAEIAHWPAPRFAEADRAPDAPRTISSRWPDLLLDVLPRLRRRSVVTEPEEPPKRRRRRENPTGKRVVVVDDTELLLDFVEEILTAAHPELQVVTAHTGTEGVRRSQLMRPDLVLLDYSLPDINGDEVCRRLLENAETASIPIVMMSGQVADMQTTAATYPNVVGTIAKPFLSLALLKLVEETLAAPPGLPPASSAKPPDKATVEAAVTHNGKGKKQRQKSANGDAPPRAPVAIPEAPPPQVPPVAPGPTPEVPPRAPVASPKSTPAVSVQVATAVEQPRAAARPTPVPAVASTVAVPSETIVLVGIALQTIAVQLTSTLRIGQIRARGASRTVSLNFPPEMFHAVVPVKTGFDLDAITVGKHGEIETARLVPNQRPLELLQINRRFAVDEIEIAPATAAVELTPTASTVMPIQMLAAFRLQAVELTPALEVARLILVARSRRVRVSLDPATAAIGAIFDATQVRVDWVRQIEEITLTPA